MNIIRVFVTLFFFLDASIISSSTTGLFEKLSTWIQSRGVALPLLRSGNNEEKSPKINTTRSAEEEYEEEFDEEELFEDDFEEEDKTSRSSPAKTPERET